MRKKVKAKQIKLSNTTWVLGDKPKESLKLTWCDKRKGK